MPEISGALEGLYRTIPNTHRNNSTYPWAVVDNNAKVVAFAVTEHTAKQWTQELNTQGFITSI
jgi:hypothetical protein